MKVQQRIEGYRAQISYLEVARYKLQREISQIDLHLGQLNGRIAELQDIGAEFPDQAVESGEGSESAVTDGDVVADAAANGTAA